MGYEKQIEYEKGGALMLDLTFKQDRQLDVIAMGRLCIDLNANELNRPMEETMTFTKYVGGLQLTLPLV